MYTDGVIEARDGDGRFFGEERLASAVLEVSRAGAPPPEVLRQVLRAVVDHQAGVLQDDATVLMVEWRGTGAERLSPYRPEAAG
jgi:serine phosphatase RsbU (regulator of sigma subunit)